jgi:hypothetical protein
MMDLVSEREIDPRGTDTKSTFNAHILAIDHQLIKLLLDRNVGYGLARIDGAAVDVAADRALAMMSESQEMTMVQT